MTDQSLYVTETEATPQTTGELFAFELLLTPVTDGKIPVATGNLTHAVFLDLIRTSDPALSAALHQPNQQRAFTTGFLRGFQQMTVSQYAEALGRGTLVPVRPGQQFRLRITILDGTVFTIFFQTLFAQIAEFTIRIDTVPFRLTQIIGHQDRSVQRPWIGYSSFAELLSNAEQPRKMIMEFASPTAFSMGEKDWGRYLKLLPEASDVFGSLARQWNLFAPPAQQLEQPGVSAQQIREWCAEQVIVARYRIETQYVQGRRFSQPGFQGTVSFDVKGDLAHPVAKMLPALARFAMYSGVGYKTAMGMGQARWIATEDAERMG